MLPNPNSAGTEVNRPALLLVLHSPHLSRMFATYVKLHAVAAKRFCQPIWPLYLFVALVHYYFKTEARDCLRHRVGPAASWMSS
jgi:hypothetical protein